MAMKRFVRDIAWVAFANYFALLAGVPLGLVTPLFFTPEAYALIGMVDAAMELLKHYPLGTHFALMRDIPLLKAQGKHAEADDVRDAVWCVSLLAGIPVALVPAALARWVFHATPESQMCYLLGCTGTVMWTLGSVYQSILKAEKRFRADSLSQVATSLVPLLVLPPCLYFLRAKGYFLSNLLVAFTTFVVYVKMFDRQPRLRWSGKAFAAVVAIGLPSLVIGLIESGYATVARWRLEPIMSQAALGLFFFAWKMNRYFVALPQAVGRVYLPGITEKLGTTKDEKDLGPHVVVPTLYMAQVMAFLMGGASFILPELVRVAYPKYTGSVEAMRIFIYAAYWAGIGSIPWRHLMATKRWFSGVAGYVLALVAVWVGLGVWAGTVTVDRAAWVSAGSMLLCNAVFVGLSFAAVSRGAWETAVRTVKTFIPFGLMIALVLAIREGWARGIAPHWPVHPLIAAMLEGALFGLSWLPIGYAFWRKYGSWLRSSPLKRGDVAADGPAPPDAPGGGAEGSEPAGP